jgi:hypothetical protein
MAYLSMNPVDTKRRTKGSAPSTHKSYVAGSIHFSAQVRAEKAIMSSVPKLQKRGGGGAMEHPGQVQ